MTETPLPENNSGKTAVVSKTFRKRLMILLIIGGIIVGGAGFYVSFWLTHPIGSGPAGPVVESQAFQNVWSERDVVLLGFGDSIAAGYGASPGKSFFKLLVENPKDEFP